MNKIEIKDRFNNEVIYSHECKNNTLKITCMKAVFDKISLYGADLRGANLYGADLRGAAIVIYGMTRTIQIAKNHIRIGCQSHSLEKWINFTDDEINSMHSDALNFWKENKEFIINRCKGLTK